MSPADQAKSSSSAPSWSGRQLTHELPAITLQGEAPPVLREEEKIGSYQQPRWTAHRRFPSTRIYVRPQGEFDMEYWYRIKVPRSSSKKVEVIQTVEVEFGLPHRFQLDLYQITRRDGNTGKTHTDNAVEIRKALADWGVLFGNPTLYLEWIGRDQDPDKIETKLLLGGEAAPSWHWGVNLVREYEMGGSHEEELELTLALSKTLSDEHLSLGVEAKLAQAHAEPNRGDWEEDYRIGPSLQYRPSKRFHFDVAPLFGITQDSKRADLFFVAGAEF